MYTRRTQVDNYTRTYMYKCALGLDEESKRRLLAAQGVGNKEAAKRDLVGAVTKAGPDVRRATQRVELQPQDAVRVQDTAAAAAADELK